MPATDLPPPVLPPPVLQLPALQFAHPGEPPLFDGLALSLPAGLHALQGDAGCGKTTLLRLLAGDLPGLAHARLNGQPLDVDSTAWRATVCHVDVRGAECDDLTAAALRDRVRQRHPALDVMDWQRHIDGFGLAPHAAKTMHMLSTGMRRKAALAAALASGAALLLFDEPTAGLDAPSTAWLVQALRRIGQQPGRAALLACGTWPAGLPCRSRVWLGPEAADTADADATDPPGGPTTR